jgi:hypothetical protein
MFDWWIDSFRRGSSLQYGRLCRRNAGWLNHQGVLDSCNAPYFTMPQHDQWSPSCAWSGFYLRIYTYPLTEVLCLWLWYTRFLAARKLAPLQRQPTPTFVGKARTNHVRATVFYGFSASMLYIEKYREKALTRRPAVLLCPVPRYLMGHGHNEAMLQLRWPQQPWFHDPLVLTGKTLPNNVLSRPNRPFHTPITPNPPRP